MQATLQQDMKAYPSSLLHTDTRGDYKRNIDEHLVGLLCVCECVCIAPGIRLVKQPRDTRCGLIFWKERQPFVEPDEAHIPLLNATQQAVSISSTPDRQSLKPTCIRRTCVCVCRRVCVCVPEEAVILHTDFPQPFGRAVILEFESHRALKLLRLSKEHETGLMQTLEN